MRLLFGARHFERTNFLLKIIQRLVNFLGKSPNSSETSLVLCKIILYDTAGHLANMYFSPLCFVGGGNVSR